MKKLTPAGKLRYLQKIKAVQDTYQRHYQEGLSMTFIHKTFIEPQYFITYHTLRNYLEQRVQTKIAVLEKEIADKEKES